MRSELSRRGRRSVRLVFRSSRTLIFAPLLIFCLVAFVTFANAQENDGDFDPNAAPPPIKKLSKSEKDQLAAESDVKDHTRLALELMDARLTKAEELNAKGDFAEMYVQLGGFHALMDETLEYLEDRNHTRDRVLDAFKRFEIVLRKFTPRLGLIRRDIPNEYDHYVRVLLKYIRDARAKAIEPLFGNTVFPNARKPLDQ